MSCTAITLRARFTRCVSRRSQSRLSEGVLRRVTRGVPIHCVLFFELFPAFFMIVSLIIGIALFMANRRADHESSD